MVTQGYIAYDNTTEVQRPAVVILPAWEGVGDYAKWRAQLLAKMGYVGKTAQPFVLPGIRTRVHHLVSVFQGVGKFRGWPSVHFCPG